MNKLLTLSLLLMILIVYPLQAAGKTVTINWSMHDKSDVQEYRMHMAYQANMENKQLLCSTSDASATSLTCENVTIDNYPAYFTISAVLSDQELASIPEQVEDPTLPAPQNLEASVLLKNEEPVQLSEITPQDYQSANFAEGELCYVDRDYTITQLPVELDGIKGIQTSNDDKNVAESTYLTFNIDKSAILYVAYDTRVSSYPSWLKDNFEKTALTISNSDSTIDYFSVWKRSVGQGLVEIPGNSYGTSDHVGANYFVLIK